MPASARVKLALLALIPVGLISLLVLVAWLQAPQVPGTVAEISRPMPALQGQGWLNGGPLGPEDLRARVVLVNFWAEWCGPCRREQPVLNELAEEYGGRVVFVGVDFMDDPAKAREFIREFRVPYPSVMDDGPLAHSFQLSYPPTTYIVDRSGVMRFALLGAQEEGELRRHIEEVLGE